MQNAVRLFLQGGRFFIWKNIINIKVILSHTKNEISSRSRTTVPSVYYPVYIICLPEDERASQVS